MTYFIAAIPPKKKKKNKHWHQIRNIAKATLPNYSIEIKVKSGSIKYFTCQRKTVQKYFEFKNENENIVTFEQIIKEHMLQ